MKLKAVLTGCATIAVLLVAAANASAADFTTRFGDEVVASVTASPEPLSLGRENSGSYEIRLNASQDGAAFTLGLIAPGWPDLRVSGSPLTFGVPVLSGEGSLVAAPPPPPPPVAPNPFPGCVRGSFSGYNAYMLDLPADSTASLTVPFSLVGAPWTSAPLQPRIQISDAVSYEDLAIPGIGVEGRLGPWVQIWRKGQKSSGLLRVKGRGTVALAGHVYSSSRLRGRKVRLSATTRNDSERKYLGRARLNRSGNFSKKVAGLPAGYLGIEGKLIASKGKPSCGLKLMVPVRRSTRASS